MNYNNCFSGKFSPKNYSKYKGNPTNIVFRSSWELKFMHYCDMYSEVLEWNSEEIVIPYFCPVQNKYRRYFVDFYIKIQEKTGEIKKYLIEIKPKKQVMPPDQNPKKKTKRWLNENITYATNQAKWKAAKEYCDDRLMEFKILTEDDIQVRS